MLPNFALALSFDGIRLLHRVSGGWMLVGETALDVDDLSGALRVLHDSALQRDPDALITKLVIPEGQIKYITLRTGDVDDAARWVSARAALDGATPYPVDELVFDMAADGPVTHVAAVARETLTEAEAFAVAHQFNPVSFVATPQTEAQFPGEPFFGPTAAAKAQMGPVPPVMRDGVAIRIVDAPIENVADAPPEGLDEEGLDDAARLNEGTAAAVASEAAADPAIETSDPAPVEDAQAHSVPDPVPDDAAAATQDLFADMPEVEAQPLEAPQSDAPPNDITDDPDALQTSPADTDASNKVADFAEPPEETLASIDEEARLAPEQPATEAAAVADGANTDDAADERVMDTADDPAADAFEDLPTAAIPPAADDPFPMSQMVSPTRDDIAATGQDQAAQFIGDDAGTEADLHDAAAPEAPEVTEDPSDAQAITDDGAEDPETHQTSPADAARPAAPITGFASRRAATSQPRLGGVTRDLNPAMPSVTAPTLPLDPNDPPAGPRRLPEPPPAAAASLQAVSPKDDARLEFVAPRRQTQATAAAATMSDPSTSFEEAQRLTIFGARRPPGDVGGKPRFLGLMLTVVLLVCLAGVAAWAAVFMEEGIAGLFRDRDPAEVEIATQQPDTPLPDVPAPATPTTGEGLSALGNRAGTPPVRSARNSVIDPPAAQARPTFAPDAAAERRAALAASELAPDTVAGTGSAEVIVPAPDTTDAAQQPATALPASTRAPSTPDLTALAAVTQIWDVSPARPSVPALSPFGDWATLDAAQSGQTRPDSRASALPLLAALNADRALQDVPSPAPAGTRFDLNARGLVIPTEDGAVNPDGVRVFAGLPPAVPPERPAPEPTVAENIPEAAQADDAQRNALAAIRPQLRPDRPDAPVAEVIAPAQNPQLAAIRPQLRPRIIPAIPDPDPAETRIIAVPESIFEDLLDEDTGAPPTPQAVATSLRPDTRPRNFERVVARATPRDAAPRPRTIRPRTVTPAVPSSASVTRQATIDNAINLGRINLIGVFGTPADRLALVRLPNGRHQKVKVGDRLDGGQVLAISDSELRYQKRGRNLSLTIPGG